MPELAKIDDRVHVVSLTPNVCDEQAAVARIDGLVKSCEGAYVCFSTVHMVMEAYDDPEFAKRVNAADLIITDGMPIVWMQRLQGHREATRIRANDLMVDLCRYAEQNGMSVGFYGGTREVIDSIKTRASVDFPGLLVTYAHSPPFRPLTAEEDARIVAEINASAPDILFMGLGCPKQEIWMSAHRDRLNCVMLGVGASFDFYAGNVKESPAWLGRLGLEWVFRLTQEPRRLWRRYLILNPRFMMLAALQLLGLKKFDR